jgi:hypothetical protein
VSNVDLCRQIAKLLIFPFQFINLYHFAEIRSKTFARKCFQEAFFVLGFDRNDILRVFFYSLKHMSKMIDIATMGVLK